MLPSAPSLFTSDQCTGWSAIPEKCGFESARVQSAVVGMVDLLGHHSVERRTDFDAWMLEIDVQSSGIGIGYVDRNPRNAVVSAVRFGFIRAEFITAAANDK